MSGWRKTSTGLLQGSDSKLASPVFAKMFNSQFKEGLGNNHPTPAKPPIPLPDDNAEAVVVLCNVIHLRTSEVPKKLALNCLTDLAVICDKYDCTSALAPWSAIWLQAGIASLAVKDLDRLLFAAYVLDSPDAFSRVSWEILFVQVGPFVILPGLIGHELVTGNILSIVNQA